MTDHESQDDPVVDDGGDTEMQTANDDLIRVSGPDTNGERLVKPMRRSRRPFTETRSLPVGLFRLSGQPNDRGATSSSVEDDWSLSDPKAGQLGGL
jgi:hypothetical protein